MGCINFIGRFCKSCFNSICACFCDYYECINCNRKSNEVCWRTFQMIQQNEYEKNNYQKKEIFEGYLCNTCFENKNKTL